MDKIEKPSRMIGEGDERNDWTAVTICGRRSMGDDLWGTISRGTICEGRSVGDD